MPLLPVPEAAPETPVAKVEAAVMVMEESISEELPDAVERLPVAEAVLEPVLEALEEAEEEEEESAVGVMLVLSMVNASRGFAIFRRTDGLAGALADFLEVLGGGVLVVAAVLGDVAGDLGGVGGADGLDVGRVRALAVDCQLALRGYNAYVERILLDGSQKACGRGCDCDARGDGQNGEDGGLCEHDVDFLVVCCCLFLGLKGIGSRKSGFLKGM
jgi:hypothetical protein